MWEVVALSCSEYIFLFFVNKVKLFLLLFMITIYFQTETECFPFEQPQTVVLLKYNTVEL